MIYLIDDKKNRQESDYGWNAERLQKFNSLLIPVYTYEEIKESQKRDAIFAPGNIILFHESFFDNTINTHNKDSVDIRSELNKHATDKKGWVVFFSGSKNSRTLDDRVAHIPVSVLYNNLEAFIEKVSESSIDLRYLLYGRKNPEIEGELLNKLKSGNDQFDETPIKSNKRKLLVLTGSRIGIPIILEGAIERTFTLEEKYEKEITQSYLNNKVKEWLSDDEVDNIFIPLCFGPSLSDYNGLQFACHIRCTDTINRLKPIFIYSFVDYSYPIECEYFNILKTKNIYLIEYTRQAFVDSLSREIEPLTNTQLSKEMFKLKLDVPSNYEDSHSIANEWAIYRWALSIGANDTEIGKVTEKIDVQLYFKYLQTIYPKTEIKSLNEDQLNIKYSGNPKILYIDDEADKGWYEIFCKILYDVNRLSFEHLDEEFNSKSQNEIINTSIDKIAKDEIDLVLLDLRLHPNDFITENIDDLTGLKLLRRIKKLNPGIQVIIFSASNKVWNWRVLQAEGADGFVIKESPDNNLEFKSTEKAIKAFVSSIKTALQKRFLKQVFDKCKVIVAHLNNYDYEDGSEYEGFLNDLKKQISLIDDSSKRISLLQSTTLDIVFLNCFNFLEKFKHYYLKEIDRQFVLGIDKVDMNRYSNLNGIIEDEGYFRRINQNDNPSWFNVLSGLFIDYFSIAKINDKEIKDLSKIKDKRNEYIHNSKDRFDQNELLMILSICEKITSKMRE